MVAQHKLSDVDTKSVVDLYQTALSSYFERGGRGAGVVEVVNERGDEDGHECPVTSGRRRLVHIRSRYGGGSGSDK